MPEEQVQAIAASPPHRACEPFLRWAGSKRKLLPELLRRRPGAYQRYIEPFAGSACLFFALAPRQAILGDINEELLEVYDVLRQVPEAVLQAMAQLADREELYYRMRDLSPSTLSPFQRTVRFIYLNRNCFNGVFRTNQQGMFNVPKGTRTGAFPPEEQIIECARILGPAVLIPGDFELVLQEASRGDFVYLDPPYAVSNEPATGEYGYGCFSLGDLDRLIKALNRVDDEGAHFILSYADTPLLTSRFERNWHIERIPVRRHVAGFSRHRATVTELIVCNF